MYGYIHYSDGKSVHLFESNGIDSNRIESKEFNFKGSFTTENWIFWKLQPMSNTSLPQISNENPLKMELLNATKCSDIVFNFLDCC